MLKTAATLTIRVGEDKTLLTLTDSAVEAVQGEAAGKMVDALAGVWAIEKDIDGGESFASLDINTLIDLRDHLYAAAGLAEVLIDCRPMDDLEPEAE